MTQQSVLIIKHGFSETCDKSVSRVASLGDVFRCTCLLRDFPNDQVTWITAPTAHTLLTNNPFIHQLILADTPDKLPAEITVSHYDIVINLEKQPDWCNFAAHVPARQRYGFKDFQADGNDCFYPESAQALSTALQSHSWDFLQETLFKTINHSWNGQRYVLGYQPRITPIYDIGLNHHVGPKWPHKVWPQHHWDLLHEKLSSRYAVSWQQSLNSVRHYIDWLASCRLIITTDSLGLHLALGLEKKIVALFGPTPHQQIYMYNQGIKLTPQCERTCIPCFQPTCAYDHTCMEYISPDIVLDAVDSLLHPTPQAQTLPHSSRKKRKFITLSS